MCLAVSYDFWRVYNTLYCNSNKSMAFWIISIDSNSLIVIVFYRGVCGHAKRQLLFELHERPVFSANVQ